MSKGETEPGQLNVVTDRPMIVAERNLADKHPINFLENRNHFHYTGTRYCTEYKEGFQEKKVLSLAIFNRGLGQLIRVKNPASMEVYWCTKEGEKERASYRQGTTNLFPSCC